MIAVARIDPEHVKRSAREAARRESERDTDQALVDGLREQDSNDGSTR